MPTLLVIAIIIALILGYGYYHAVTHGWLYIDIRDASVKPYSGNIRDAEIRLLDADGKFLADGKSDHQFGVVRLSHPDAGDCSAEEGSAASSQAAQNKWKTCFETLSTWLVRWAGRVRFVDVKFAGCDLKRSPVTVRKSRDDWWLWWVPLPHIGGKPFTYFSLSVNVDRSNCILTKRPTA